MSEVGAGWQIDEPPELYGIDPDRLISLVPAAGYRSILLPRWFPLERAPLLAPADEDQYLGFWHWNPLDGLSVDAQPPHWVLGSPWRESPWIGYDDEDRSLAPDVTIEDINARTQKLLGDEHLLTPLTYRSAWGKCADLEPPTWVELPLLAISTSAPARAASST